MKITTLHIENFRSIENQTVEDIQGALILIGKNNAGKSAVLTALRVLLGDYTPTVSDFYKSSTTFIVKGSFCVSNEFLESLFYDIKVGVLKIPSTIAEYNSSSLGTRWEGITFNEYKNARNERQSSELYNDISTIEEFQPLWLNSIKKRLSIENNIVSVSLSCSKLDCKVHYTINDEDVKDFTSFLPKIAFIDETRNFLEEETGKSKTLTSNIFNNVLTNKLFNSAELTCKECENRDCETRCIDQIYGKQIEVLSLNELEKLVNYKTNQASIGVTRSISQRFQRNYRPDYRVIIQATSCIDKSFILSTKIFDPMLNSEINLSNVGAGVWSIYILSLLQAYQEMMGKYSIFIIEEPELYLHPELQKSMARTLWEISNANQVFFTTHSPIMLKEFNSNEVRNVKLDMDHYKTIIEIVGLDTILREIGYSSQDILHTDFVLFVEGKDDLAALSTIIKKYYNVSMDNLLVIDTKSCNHIEIYATLRFLHKTTMNNAFAIIRDADTMEIESVKRKTANQMRSNIDPDYLDTVNSHIFITEYSSIEGYFIDIDLLITKHIFRSLDVLEENLKRGLTANKERHIEYFKQKNERHTERINEFETSYDSLVQEPLEHLEWLKQNIRGHDIFGYLNAAKISFEDYIEELPSTAFQGLIDFLDSISYFMVRKKPI